MAEAALTGESEPVLKDVALLAEPAGLGDRLNMVFNGTAVTRGRGRAVVTATGMATEMGRIAGLLGRTGEQQTPLQRELDRVGGMLGIAVGSRATDAFEALEIGDLPGIGAAITGGELRFARSRNTPRPSSGDHGALRPR